MSELIRCGGSGFVTRSLPLSLFLSFSPIASYWCGGNRKLQPGFLCTGQQRRREKRRSSDGRTLSPDDVRLNGHQILDLHVLLQRVNASDEEGSHVSARSGLHHEVCCGITYIEYKGRADHATATLELKSWGRQTDTSCWEIEVPESPHCLLPSPSSHPTHRVLPWVTGKERG